jgi:hypothetical protein
MSKNAFEFKPIIFPKKIDLSVSLGRESMLIGRIYSLSLDARLIILPLFFSHFL